MKTDLDIPEVERKEDYDYDDLIRTKENRPRRLE